MPDEDAAVNLKQLARKIRAKGGLSFGSADALLALLGIAWRRLGAGGRQRQGAKGRSCARPATGRRGGDQLSSAQQPEDDLAVL